MNTPQTPSMNTTMGIHSNSARVLVENCPSSGAGPEFEAAVWSELECSPDDPGMGPVSPDEKLLSLRSGLGGPTSTGMRCGLVIGAEE